MSSVDIEFYLERAFVASLRSIYELHPKLTYNQDDTKTKILISATYPTFEASGRLPAIIVGDVSYEFQEIGLYNNFLDDIIENGKVVGKRFVNQVPFTISMTCIAESDSAAKNLANLTANYVNFDASEVFSSGCNLDIKRVAKSPGGYRRNIPQDMYSHIVSVSGSVPWQGDLRYQADKVRTIASVRLALQALLNNQSEV